MLAYNVQDESYYDCAVTTYTAGYFAPEYIVDAGMNVIVIDSFDWANRVGEADDSCTRASSPTSSNTCCMNYSDPGELSWVDEGLADLATFLNGYPPGGSHFTFHQVFHRETSPHPLGRRPRELRCLVLLLPVPLGAGGRQRWR